MGIEFISTAAEALPAGSGCAESKNKNHKGVVWAVHQGMILPISSQIFPSLTTIYIYYLFLYNIENILFIYLLLFLYLFMHWMALFLYFPTEHGRDGEESWGFPPGSTDGAEKGDGSAAEKDNDGHSECIYTRSLVFFIPDENFTLLILFCNYVTATTRDGHREEVPPVHVILKTDICLFIWKTSLVFMLSL